MLTWIRLMFELSELFASFISLSLFVLGLVWPLLGFYYATNLGKLASLLMRLGDYSSRRDWWRILYGSLALRVLGILSIPWRWLPLPFLKCVSYLLVGRIRNWLCPWSNGISDGVRNDTNSCLSETPLSRIVWEFWAWSPNLSTLSAFFFSLSLGWRPIDERDLGF